MIIKIGLMIRIVGVMNIPQAISGAEAVIVDIIQNHGFRPSLVKGAHGSGLAGLLGMLIKSVKDGILVTGIDRDTLKL